jgi:hypothetical protein
MENREPDFVMIQIRVTQDQRKRIDRTAEKCGLTRSEFIRQIALGYEPQVPLPHAFYRCCEDLDKLIKNPYSGEVSHKALGILSKMQMVLSGELIVPEPEEHPLPEAESVPEKNAASVEKQIIEEPEKSRKKWYQFWERG